MNARPTLVLLTDRYPFGNTSETFLETEIEILASRFERIHVLPSHRDAGIRKLPANAELVEMGWLEPPTTAAKRRALASPAAAGVLLSMLGPGAQAPRHAKAWRYHLDVLATIIVKLRLLERFVCARALHDAVFCDYWLENSTLAMSLLRRSGVISTAVCRAHGFDIFEDQWDTGVVPFQTAKAKGLDAVFAVSQAGATYLEEQVRGFAGKVRVCRLGVLPSERPRPEGGEDRPVVVSCSSLRPVKRVHLIPELLARLGRPVRWLHLGDGPDRTRVEQAASKLGPEVDWELLGHVDNREVLGFYDRQWVDVFLSLSRSEGLPVSMMEAQRQGIPIVACGVNGVPEIVTELTGILLNAESRIDELAAGLAVGLEPGRFDETAIRAFQRAHFDAEINYNTFADALIALHQGEAPAAGRDLGARPQAEQDRPGGGRLAARTRHRDEHPWAGPDR